MELRKKIIEAISSRQVLYNSSEICRVVTEYPPGMKGRQRRKGDQALLEKRR